MSGNVTSIILRLVMIGSIFVAICVISLGFVSYNYLAKVKTSLPPVSALAEYSPPLPSIVLSRDNEKIGEIYTEKRYPLTIKEINPVLIKAFLAAEDARFYKHNGIDLQGILRAGMHYVIKSESVQGGSTITQQLAKNLLLSRERTLERKVKDILLALEIEKQMPKDKILELYLNTIYLGNQSYGVEAAAKNYFRKSTTELNLAECAILAGLPPAPSAYDPTLHLEKARNRQKFVLEQMQKLGLIQPAEREDALTKPIKVFKAISPNLQMAPNFFMEVKKQVDRILGEKEIANGGFTIHTSIDMRLQKMVQGAVNKKLETFSDSKGFLGPIKKHKENFTTELQKILASPFSEEERERAIVVDIFPKLDAVAIVAQQGLGLLLLEDHRWALGAASKSKGNNNLDFADILSVGDEVHVSRIQRGSPKRINARKNEFKELGKYLQMYPSSPINKGISYYQLDDTDDVEAAALIMHAQTGDILAMVGGSNFLKSQFNRATQAKRQVGSSVKPLYYALAQDLGFSPASKIDSPPLVIGDWKPENYSNEFIGRTTLRSSLIHSYNVASIQLAQAIGLPKVFEYLNKLGLKWSNDHEGLSVALGAGNATLLEMLQAYSPLANNGILTEPRYITKIVNKNDEVLYTGNEPELRAISVSNQNVINKKKAKLNAGKDYEEINTANVKLAAKHVGGENAAFEKDKQVISPAAAFVTMKIMQDVVRFGTGTRAAGVTPLAAGKTGTTNGYTDAWFIGITPNLIGGVWVGFDDAKKSLGSRGTGGVMAAPIWHDIMQPAVELFPSKEWKEPSEVSYVRINPETGDLATDGGGISIPIVAGSEPGSPTSKDVLGLLGSDSTNSSVTTNNNDDMNAMREMF